MMPLLDVREDHLKIVQDILHKFVPEREVWAFGSRAKWLAKEYSDLDLCIVGDSALNFRTLGLLEEAFEDSDLPYKVDVVDWATTSESFRKIIERDRVVVQKAGEKAGNLQANSLAAMCEAIIDCPHSTPVWTESGYIVLRNQNIKDGRLDLSAPSFTDEGHFKHRIRRLAPRAGDIVITREAPMGEVCKIPEGLQCCLGQRQVLLRPKAGVNSDYLLYALQSPFVQNQIRWNEGTGSTVSNIRIPVLEKIEIPRHGDTESSIAKMLSSLDAKIDLNRRINQTLEAMAQAIFKSWFVDFEPVKAKMAAKARWQAQHLPSPSGRGAGGEGVTPQTLLTFARENRRNATDAESLMWRLLRDRRLGVKFRRQHPWPPYIIDFYCHERRIAIELDGSQHYTPEGIEADYARSSALEAQGITVLRFSNREVLQETEAVLERVWNTLTPTPLPEGEGLDVAMLRAAMSAISGIPEAELDALKRIPAISFPIPSGNGSETPRLPPGESLGVSSPPSPSGRGAGGEGSLYDKLAATAALFPDEMEESELGEIPRGWFVRRMPDCIDVNPSRTLKKGSVARYLDMANVPTNSARVQNVVSREFTSGSKFRNGDTLLARITPCLENGKTAFVDFLSGDEVGWGSTEFIVLRPKDGLPELFAYFLCRYPDFRAFAIAQMAGTSGRQRVPNDCFGGYKLVEPAEPVAVEFGRLVGAALNQIKALDEEAKTLASLRDTLLPKLLSGELSVENIVPTLEATA